MSKLADAIGKREMMRLALQQVAAASITAQFPAIRGRFRLRLKIRREMHYHVRRSHSGATVTIFFHPDTLASTHYHAMLRDCGSAIQNLLTTTTNASAIASNSNTNGVHPES